MFSTGSGYVCTGEKLGAEVECVFTSEIDKECQDVYKENFGDSPHGDITKISAK
ncbi:MAG: DNA cytosine methyltransferase, partial [Planctomycetes bacterium]|nr:DNA cytosine methyltransferase [Planctomycetota bacterium]